MNTFLICALLFLLLSMAFLMKPFRPGLAAIQFVTASVFSILVLVMYFSTGQIKEWEQFEFKEAQVKQMMEKLKSRDAVIDKLKAKLEQEPESAEGWFLIGRLYRSNNQMLEAETALKKACALDSTESKYISAYLETRFWNNGGYYRNKDLDLIQQQKTFTPDVLNLIAGYYFQHQRYEQATRYWKQMAAMLTDDIAAQNELMKAIDASQSKLKLQQKGRVWVTVDTDDKVKKQFKPDASVFIVVKISKAGPPLAVVRRNLSELGTKVLLSDAEAMLMNRVISTYMNQNVTVGARLEPSGKLTAGDGNPKVYKTIKIKENIDVSLMLTL